MENKRTNQPYFSQIINQSQGERQNIIVPMLKMLDIPSTIFHTQTDAEAFIPQTQAAYSCVCVHNAAALIEK